MYVWFYCAESQNSVAFQAVLERGQQPTLNKVYSETKCCFSSLHRTHLRPFCLHLKAVLRRHSLATNVFQLLVTLFFFSHSLVPSFLVFSLSLPPLPDADFLSLHHIELSVSVGPRVSWSLMDGEHVGGAAVLNRHGGLKRWGSKC